MLVVFTAASIIVLPETSRLVLEPSQPPSQRVPATVSTGVKLPEGEADNLPTSTARFGMSGDLPSLRHMPSWRVQG